jgi:hypothetical protein
LRLVIDSDGQAQYTLRLGQREQEISRFHSTLTAENKVIWEGPVVLGTMSNGLGLERAEG